MKKVYDSFALKFCVTRPKDLCFDFNLTLNRIDRKKKKRARQKRVNSAHDIFFETLFRSFTFKFIFTFLRAQDFSWIWWRNIFLANRLWTDKDKNWSFGAWSRQNLQAGGLGVVIVHGGAGHAGGGAPSHAAHGLGHAGRDRTRSLTEKVTHFQLSCFFLVTSCRICSTGGD